MVVSAAQKRTDMATTSLCSCCFARGTRRKSEKPRLGVHGATGFPYFLATSRHPASLSVFFFKQKRSPEDCYWHRTLESHTFRWETVSYVFHGKIRPTMLASSGRIFRHSGWIVEDETTISSEKFRRHSRTSSDKLANVFSHGQTAGMRNGTRYSSSSLVPLKTDATGFHDRETRVACLFT